MLITTPRFCSIVGIGLDRFEQRRLRERLPDVTGTAAEGTGFATMPIVPLERGQRGAYDSFDAVRLRAVIRLEASGIDFGSACFFISRAGIAPDLMFPTEVDTFAAQWLEPCGDLRRICGTAQELRRAMPEAPLAATTINLTAIRNEISERAKELFRLRLVGMSFEEVAS